MGAKTTKKCEVKNERWGLMTISTNSDLIWPLKPRDTPFHFASLHLDIPPTQHSVACSSPSIIPPSSPYLWANNGVSKQRPLRHSNTFTTTKLVYNVSVRRLTDPRCALINNTHLICSVCRLRVSDQGERRC